MTQNYIVGYLHRIGQALFQEAQRLAPDSTGRLKQSGSLFLTNKGFEITYAVPYAYALHEGGFAQEPLTTNWISKIPRHRRRVKGKTVNVKAHTKTYKQGFKPVPILAQKGGGGLTSTTSGLAGATQNVGVFAAGGAEEVEDWMTLNMNIRKQRPDRPWIQQAWERISRNDPMTKGIRSIRNMIIKNPNGSLSLIMNR